jgi:hypothetical protein
VFKGLGGRHQAGDIDERFRILHHLPNFLGVFHHCALQSRRRIESPKRWLIRFASRTFTLLAFVKYSRGFSTDSPPETNAGTWGRMASLQRLGKPRQPAPDFYYGQPTKPDLEWII